MDGNLWIDLPLPTEVAYLPREWFGEFPAPSERDLELWKRVREYHIGTERFDRLLPHYRSVEGSAIPADGWARRQSNRYASKLRQQLSAGFTPGEWVDANSRYLVSRDCQQDMASLPWPYPPES